MGGMRTTVPFTILDSWVVYDQELAMLPGLARVPDGDLVMTSWSSSTATILNCHMADIWRLISSTKPIEDAEGAHVR